MGSSFEKMQQNLKLYAPFGEYEKRLMEAMDVVHLVYGQDYLIDTRFIKVYVTSKFIEYFNRFKASKRSAQMPEFNQILEMFEEMFEEVQELQLVDTYFLAREVALWTAYKLLYKNEPPLVDGLYDYQEEEFSAIMLKCDELGEPEEIVNKYASGFYNNLREKGYIYRLATNNEAFLN